VCAVLMTSKRSEQRKTSKSQYRSAKPTHKGRERGAALGENWRFPKRRCRAACGWRKRARLGPLIDIAKRYSLPPTPVTTRASRSPRLPSRPAQSRLQSAQSILSSVSVDFGGPGSFVSDSSQGYLSQVRSHRPTERPQPESPSLNHPACITQPVSPSLYHPACSAITPRICLCSTPLVPQTPSFSGLG
jgi:hypothetical protein